MTAYYTALIAIVTLGAIAVILTLLPALIGG